MATERGLYQKYVIQKADGTPVDPNAVYIVLRVDNHGADTKEKLELRDAARIAVSCFATNIGSVNRELSDDLIRLVYSCAEQVCCE